MKGLSNRLLASGHTIFGHGLSRLWPQDCFVCGTRAGVAAICRACEENLPWHGTPACPVCALPTPTGESCGQCLKRPPHFDATSAAFVYEHPVREMVMALKFGAAFAVRDVLANALLAALGDGGGVAADCIVPMPLHRARIVERGFNQAMELARGVSEALALPVMPHLIERDIATRHQAGATLRQRIKNVRGAFRCPAPLGGKRVIVIDDVMTSGTTLDEVARTMKLAGAARVTNLVVARTLRST